MNLGRELPDKATSVDAAGRPTGKHSDLVGEIISAPTSFLRNGDCLRASFSKTGIANAKVLPDPVTACPCCINTILTDRRRGKPYLHDYVLVLHE